MLRLALAIALGFSVAGLTTVTAEDKKEEKATKLEGKLVCTKCTLNETKACGHALQVKSGDKTITYYIADKGGKEKYHGKVCPGGTELDAVVTGKVTEKDKKKTVSDAKVELK
jgi:hypothetical protein